VNLVQLSKLVTPERIRMLNVEGKKEALGLLVDLVCRSVPELKSEKLLDLLLAREAIMSTGIGLGIAVPHARLKSMQNPVLAVGVSPKGINYESLDDRPVHIIVLIVVPAESQKQYLRILARVTLLLKNAQLRQRLLEAGDAEAIYKILSEY